MPEYTPTTEEVLFDTTFYDGMGGPIDEDSFYRWLNSVKAEAWDEGYSFSEPYCSVPCGACDQCMSEDIKNPYLKGECR